LTGEWVELPDADLIVSWRRVAGARAAFAVVAAKRAS